MEGSQGAAVDVDGEVKTIVAAADALLPVGGAAAAQFNCPIKPAYGHRLSHGSSLTSGNESETPNASMPGYGAALDGVENNSSKGTRDVLGVLDCVNEDVSDWLEVAVPLRVVDGVCNCDVDPVVLAVRE